MDKGKYNKTGSYGAYWESWKPALVKGLVGVGVFVLLAITYGVMLSHYIGK